MHPTRRKRFVKRMAALIQRRVPLRVHMATIFLAVIAFGVVASKLLVLAGVDARGVRWSLGAALAYAFFLLCVRIWIDKLHPSLDSNASEYVGHAAQQVVESMNSPLGDAVVESLASNARGLGVPAPRRTASVLLESRASRSSSSKKGIDLDFGDGDGAGKIALIVLVIALIVAAIVFIVQAPIILGEAGAEALLAVSLRRRLGRSAGSGWLGSVVARTIWIAVAVVVVAAIAGVVVDHSEATHASRLAPSTAFPPDWVRPR